MTKKYKEITSRVIRQDSTTRLKFKELAELLGQSGSKFTLDEIADLSFKKGMYQWLKELANS
jgi:hypothetical protein